MSGGSLSPDERDALLRDLARLASDGDLPPDEELLRTFLPLPVHGRVLDDEIMVIRGGRGAGKSMLFRALRALNVLGVPANELFPGTATVLGGWVEGFAQQPDHPAADVVASFASGAQPADIRQMWLVHLVGRLTEAGVARPDAWRDMPELFQVWRDERHGITRWREAAAGSLSKLMQALDTLERRLRSEDRVVVVTYDHLDRIGITDRTSREAATSALLLLWLTLSTRYRQIRAKVFVREDLFTAALSGGADASKLRARSISLDWSTQALYRMLIRHMANASPGLRDWMQTGQNAVPLRKRGQLGWFPPDSLPEAGRCSQQGFVNHLVGRQMGKGVKKGYVYRWIPNRLQDAHQIIAPRAFVNLVAYAAEAALTRGPRAKYSRLLHPTELQAALDTTSSQRADEVSEEYPLVALLQELRGLQVPASESDVVKRLEAGEVDAAPDALRQLLDIGVLRRRSDHRIDVPDVYRYGYGIKRKGGVARPR